MADMVRLAIDEALKRNWKKAVDINRAILKVKPDDVEALNRLAFALTESGITKEARQVYNKVLSINRFNPIALKNLKRLSLLRAGKAAGKKSDYKPNNMHYNNFSGLFLEEVGKTKVVTLINLAEANVISGLHPTNQVLLVPRRRGVAVTTADDVYIGALPDDIARRLYILITGGNKYDAYIKSVDRNEVAVFIRETLRKTKYKNQPSFLGKGSTYYPFVREEALAEEDKPDVSKLEDLDEEDETREEGSEESPPEEVS